MNKYFITRISKSRNTDAVVVTADETPNYFFHVQSYTINSREFEPAKRSL